MNGIFYGIGVGPGDPELMTLKAVRILRECDLLAVPESGGAENAALDIALGAAPELAEKPRLPLTLPMTRDKKLLDDARDKAARTVSDALKLGKNVAFVTLGDVTVYSTYTYLHTRVEALGFEARMIPGVPSFCAAAARLGEALAEAGEPLHILPASYEGADGGLSLPGTKVLMKAGKQLEQVKALLTMRGLADHARLVSRCGMEGERVCRSISQAGGGEGYFSLIIVKDGN